MHKLTMFAALIAAGCHTNLQNQPGEPIESCAPGELLGCDGSSLLTCDADGETVSATTCAAGCNAEAVRCNECTPSTSACGPDNEVLTCGADGLLASSERCAVGCTDDPAGARCEHLAPRYLASGCDVTADSDLHVIAPITLDTDDDATCNGGIAPRINGGAEICVIHHRSINLEHVVSVRGSRAIALVADDDLRVAQDLDVAAKGGLNGPGGGVRSSGAAAAIGGGGGAGGKHNGAGGGGLGEFGTNAGQGGQVFDPFAVDSFQGGARAATPLVALGNYAPVGGGGGGALMLVACRGKVVIDGVIDAGGGGGGGGGDSDTASHGVKLLGGAGGGAGGYIVIQGVEVEIGGMLFANGGGGGGGCSGDQCVGGAGANGRARTTTGNGGTSNNGASGGKGGGSDLVFPINGTSAFTGAAGGGGGAQGRIQIFTPPGTRPTVSPLATISPALEPDREVPVD